jgi:hypothetical protein
MVYDMLLIFYYGAAVVVVVVVVVEKQTVSLVTKPDELTLTEYTLVTPALLILTNPLPPLSVVVNPASK